MQAVNAKPRHANDTHGLTRASNPTPDLLIPQVKKLHTSRMHLVSLDRYGATTPQDFAITPHYSPTPEFSPRPTRINQGSLRTSSKCFDQHKTGMQGLSQNTSPPLLLPWGSPSYSGILRTGTRSQTF